VQLVFGREGQLGDELVMVERGGEAAKEELTRTSLSCRAGDGLPAA
jgi:hypothetical protein